MPYLGTFFQNLKNCCHILYQYLRICQNTYFYVKKIIITLGPKCPYLGTIRLEFKKIIIVFEINTLEFFKMPSFT